MRCLSKLPVPAAYSAITSWSRCGHLFLSFNSSLSYLSVLRKSGYTCLSHLDVTMFQLSSMSGRHSGPSSCLVSSARPWRGLRVLASLSSVSAACALLLTGLLATYVFKQVDIHDALCEIMWLLSLPDVCRTAACLSPAVTFIFPTHQLQFVNSLLSA